MSVPPSSSASPARSSNRNLLLIAGAILGLCVCGACVATLGAVFVLPAVLGGGRSTTQAGSSNRGDGSSPAPASAGARSPSNTPAVQPRSTPGSVVAANLVGRWLYSSLTISKPGQPDEVHTNTQTLYLNPDSSWELVLLSGGNNVQSGAGTFEVRGSQLVLNYKDGSAPEIYNYKLDSTGTEITLVTNTPADGTWTIVAERQSK